MLEVLELCAWYGQTQALFGIDFDIAAGETLALVGTNGAGKSTTVSAVAGLVTTSGSISFDGEPIGDRKPYERARAGIAVVPETRDLFWKMTVRENLVLGCGPGAGGGVDEALDLFPAIAGRMDSRVSDLSGGEQQMVAIARAMVRRPRLLMLDEPSLGLAPRIVTDVYERLRALKDTGITILLVEQSIPLAQGFADRLCLLRSGEAVTTVAASDTEAVGALSAVALGERAVGATQ
jgi:branched-chain amino acid transport system ATP-binding protein